MSCETVYPLQLPWDNHKEKRDNRAAELAKEIAQVHPRMSPKLVKSMAEDLANQELARGRSAGQPYTPPKL